MAINQTSNVGIERIKISVKDDFVWLFPPPFIGPLSSIFENLFDKKF